MGTDTPLGPPPLGSTPHGGRTLRTVAAFAVAATLCLAGGCSIPPLGPPVNAEQLLCPERLDRGYILLLPGIMGCNPADRELALLADHELIVGLAQADVPTAIEMYDWTQGKWKVLSNLRGLARNRREAQRIAQKIVDYQDQYPGRPVHLIGYSGGAAIAVMALEALPPERKVTGAVLLAATLSPDYDLRPAMRHTEQALHHFYSPVDVAVLMGTMALVGTTDGRHTFAAGAWGFTLPRGLEEAECEQYERGLVQESYTLEMLTYGHSGGHFGWAKPAFVQRWLAPLVNPPAPPMPTPTAQTVSYGQ